MIVTIQTERLETGAGTGFVEGNEGWILWRWDRESAYGFVRRAQFGYLRQ